MKNEGNADANKTTDDDKKDIGKLFSKASDNGSEAEAAKANASPASSLLLLFLSPLLLFYFPSLLIFAL